MPHIVCTSPRFALTVVAALLVAALGCHDDAQSPTGPQEPTTPALATAAAGSLSFRQVSAGETHACGVTMYCWGENAFGQLGDGTSTQRLLPVPVAAAE